MKIRIEFSISILKLESGFLDVVKKPDVFIICFEFQIFCESLLNLYIIHISNNLFILNREAMMPIILISSVTNNNSLIKGGF